MDTASSLLIRCTCTAYRTVARPAIRCTILFMVSRSTARSTAPRLTREALVDAAMAIADEHGLEALSIRRLAKEVGVTPMAIYWHVADKEALLEALGERMFSQI